jgi:hypothetical protein
MENMLKLNTYLLGLTLSLALTASAQVAAPPDARRNNEDGVEILTRGPVHEAFAETIAFDPEPGVVIAKVAPEAIEELPPEQKPDGANVAWIPGYWAWDDERTDFLWISGIWRSLPPGRQWVPGYWGNVREGSQWISGYWADAQLTEVEYLPEPPTTVEEGPNIEAPSENHIWTPGCWVWNETRYAWRPGFWVEAQPNWIWIPAHYVWCPRGYLFVNGYYDYSVARRGVLFAPVYFSSGTYSRQGFSYSPVTAINPAVFSNHLFLRPSYGHYYFGDYYSANYSTRGYSPWFSYHSSRSGYDPFYSHQRWQNRRDDQWTRRVETDFNQRRDNEGSRPPRTWAGQQSGTTNNDHSFVIAASLDNLAKSKDSPIRFQRVPKDERQQLGQRGQDAHSVRAERQKLEAIGSEPPAASPVRAVKPAKARLPKSAFVADPVERFKGEQAPPKAQEDPKLDSKREPKPRVPREVQQPKARPEQPPLTGTTRPSTPQAEPTAPKKPMAPPRNEPTIPKQPTLTPRPETNPPKQPSRPERPAPKPEPRVEKLNPKTQPRPQAEAPRPKPQPKSEKPAVNPPPQPRVDQNPPKPQPRSTQPKPQQEPKGESKGNSKGKSKD